MKKEIGRLTPHEIYRWNFEMNSTLNTGIIYWYLEISTWNSITPYPTII